VTDANNCDTSHCKGRCYRFTLTRVCSTRQSKQVARSIRLWRSRALCEREELRVLVYCAYCSGMQSSSVAFAVSPAVRTVLGGRFGAAVCERRAQRKLICATMETRGSVVPSWESLAASVPQPDFVRGFGQHVQPTKVWEADRLPGTSQKSDIRVIYYRDAAQWCLYVL
jgi:hypothetical protein